MKGRTFFLILFLIAAIGTVLWWQQQIAITEARRALAQRVEKISSAQSTIPSNQLPNVPERPSGELLQLRAEVTALRNELDESKEAQISREESANEWALIHRGPKLSERPGYISITQATNVGFATPTAAFQTFNYMIRNPPKDPYNDDKRTMELYDVPDDYDVPGRYSGIDIGEGIGGEVGYLIRGVETTASNVVQLYVEYEKADGSSFLRTKIVKEHNGRWRMPATVTERKPPAQ